MLISFVYAHTAIMKIDVADTDIFDLRYDSSIGDKYKSYMESNFSSTSALNYDAKTSTDRDASGENRQFISGMVNDKAPILDDYKPPQTPMNVQPGQSIMVSWTTNGHSSSRMPIDFHYDPSYPIDKPITLNEYFKDTPLFPQSSTIHKFDSVWYSELRDTSVVCKTNVPQNQFVKVVGDYVGSGNDNNKICSHNIQLPTTLKPGLQRIVMTWFADFNPVMLFDLVYVNVGTGAEPTDPTGPTLSASPTVPKDPTPLPATGTELPYKPLKCNK